MLKCSGEGKHKRLKTSGFIITCVVMCVLVMTYHHNNSEPIVQHLEYPYIAFNFDPENQDVNPSGVWIYNIKTEEVSIVGNDLTYESDCNFQRNKVLGWINSDVVEVDTENGVTRILSQGYYGDSDLLPFTLKYRPGSSDFSALTSKGELVLWEEEKREFRLLAQFDWNGWSFSYSWAGDGTKLFIPDQTGVAVMDLNTLEQNHWLTLPITYPVPTEHIYTPYYRKSFEVAKDGSCIVYRSNAEIRFSEVSEDGNMGEAVILNADVGAQCGFAIAPDSQTIVFTVTRNRSSLFVDPYYEVWLYDNQNPHKILNSKGVINGEVSVFW